jgi:hypothetical protein
MQNKFYLCGVLIENDMSKVQDTKNAQGYTDKPRSCGNCANFKCDHVERKSMYGVGSWMQEVSMRCGIGGFAVKKMGCCDLFKKADQAQKGGGE